MEGQYSVADLVRELETVRLDLLRVPPAAAPEHRETINGSLARMMQESEHSSRTGDIITNAQRGLQLVDDAVAIRRKAATELDHYVETHLKGGAPRSSGAGGARWVAPGCKTHAQHRKARMDGWALAGVMVENAGELAKSVGSLLDEVGGTLGWGAVVGVATALLLKLGHKQLEAGFRSGLTHAERRNMRVQSWKDLGKGLPEFAWAIAGTLIPEHLKFNDVSLKEMYEYVDEMIEIGTLSTEMQRLLDRGSS